MSDTQSQSPTLLPCRRIDSSRESRGLEESSQPDFFAHQLPVFVRMRSPDPMECTLLWPRVSPPLPPSTRATRSLPRAARRKRTAALNRVAAPRRDAVANRPTRSVEILNAPEAVFAHELDLVAIAVGHPRFVALVLDRLVEVRLEHVHHRGELLAMHALELLP